MDEGIFYQLLDVYVAVHERIMPLLSPTIFVEAGTLKELFLPNVLNDDNMVEEVIINYKT
jgi:hypothetical protein